MKNIPLHSITVIIGPAKSGKTTWANAHFKNHEIVSAAQVKLELCGDANNTWTSHQVWEEITRRVELKAKLGQRVVVDSTNLKFRDREPFIEIAKKLGLDLIYVLINSDLNSKLQGCGNDSRMAEIVERSHQLYQSVEREIKTGDNIASVVNNPSYGEVFVVPYPEKHPKVNKILAVGDVHGNFAAMESAVNLAESTNSHIIWLGDVVDYGSQNLRCMKLAYDTVRFGNASMIWGNHERKIDKWISSDWGETYHGRLSDANLITVNEILGLNIDRRERFHAAWIALRNWSWNHVVVDNWMFTHGAALPSMWTNAEHRLGGALANAAFFGQVDRHIPNRADGYPNRVWEWVLDIPRDHTVVVGHDWLDRVHNEITIKSNDFGGRAIVADCGSSKGGRLCALKIDCESNEFEPVYFG